MKGPSVPSSKPLASVMQRHGVGVCEGVPVLEDDGVPVFDELDVSVRLWLGVSVCDADGVPV